MNEKINLTCSQHKGMKIKLVCLNNTCTEFSRFLCKYCIKNHKDNEFFIDIKELMHKNIGEIYNFPISVNQQAYQKILQQCKEQEQSGENSNDNQFKHIILSIREFFDKFKEEVIQKINKTQKDMIIKLESEYQNSKFCKETFLSEMESTFNLSNLRNIINDFSSNQANEIKTNQKLKEYLEEQKKKEMESEVLQMVIRDSVSIDLSVDKIKNNLEKRKVKYIEGVQQALSGKISLLRRNLLQFFSANYQASKEHVHINDNIIKFSNSGSQYKVMYSEVFKRDQEIQLRFLLDCQGTFEQDFFVIGVVQDGKEENGHNYGPDGGNYFMVNNHDGHTSDKSSELIGVNLKDIYKDGIELFVDILVEQNRFELYDAERKSVRKNTHEFRQTEDWRFIVSAPRSITPNFTFL